MKKGGIFLSLSLVLLVSGAYSQTWGCAERDHKCQLDAATKALNADPKNPENYYNIGLVFQRSGNHSEAVESFSMYVLIPGVKAEFLADGHNNRGISHRALKRHTLAIADYTKAIELNPKKSAQFLTNRGNAYSDMKETAKAMADYDKAIGADPNYALAYAARGALRADLKDTEKALTDYAKAIELDPTYPEPYYNRGHLLSGKQEFAKAIPDYDKYIALIKGNPVYLADALMNRGIAHFYTGSPLKAVDDFTQIIGLFPDNINTYKARALVYRELKKTDLAEADERKAAEVAKQNP